MDRIFIHKSGAELWQGSMEDADALLKGAKSNISVIGLFAREFQPEDKSGRFEIIRFGYDDVPILNQAEFGRVAAVADRASDIFSDRLRKGKSCLSSCMAGLNRSGLVSALTIMKLTRKDPDQVIQHIRDTREPQLGMPALCNPSFVKLIRSLYPLRRFTKVRPSAVKSQL